MEFTKMREEHTEECADLMIDVFTKAPWYDTYRSRQQVIDFFHNYMNSSSFLGYVLKDSNGLAAMSVGLKKPWLDGMEYYIDQFCVRTDRQGRGIGSHFLKLIEEDIRKEKMNAVILNTDRGFPSERFYLKNGFRPIDGLITLVK